MGKAQKIILSGRYVASHAGVFRGARFSSLPRDEKRAPLKTPAWEARRYGDPCGRAGDRCRIREIWHVQVVSKVRSDCNLYFAQSI